MKFGLFYVLEAPDGDYRKAWTRMMGQIQYGEELGYESVWLAEHHGSLYGSMPRLAVAAAAIAERTTTMRIGTAVTILPFDNPVRTAEDFAMVDVISNGRLDFGVGRAYQPLEFKNMGLASRQDHSRELFQESLDIVLGLWNNDKFSYQGKHWQLEDVECHPRPVQKPVPIHVAAISPETFGMVAAKNLNIIQAATLMPLAELKAFCLDAKRKLIEKGHSPQSLDFPLLWITHVASSFEEGKSRSASALKWYFDTLLPEDYPVRAEKTDRPTRRGAAFVLTRPDGAVLLRRRPKRGLLGGMSEVPGTDWADIFDEAGAIGLAPGLASRDAWRKLPGRVVHVFTHFRLELTVYAAEATVGAAAPADHWWSPVGDLAGEALPSLMKKVIAAALPDPRPLANSAGIGRPR